MYVFACILAYGYVPWTETKYLSRNLLDIREVNIYPVLPRKQIAFSSLPFVQSMNIYVAVLALRMFLFVLVYIYIYMIHILNFMYNIYLYIYIFIHCMYFYTLPPSGLGYILLSTHFCPFSYYFLTPSVFLIGLHYA